MNKTYGKIFFLVFMLLLVACSPSASAIQTAIAQTQVLSPSPLAELNLDDILLQTGDLPTSFISEQINLTWWENNAIVTTSNKVFTQMISFKGQSLAVSTYSMVALFDSPQDQEKAYQLVVATEGLREYGDSMVGEKSAFVTKWTGTVSDDVYLVYTRCKALVVIHLWNIGEQDILSYGQRLDDRIKPLVCP